MAGRWLVPVMLAVILLVAAFGLQRAARDGIEQRRELLLRQRIEGITQVAHDNDPLRDVVQLREATAFTTPQAFRVHRLRLRGEPQALVLQPVVAAGYSGPIQLAVGITADGRVSAVRVLRHRETAGLGDGIAAAEWLTAFAGRSLDEPPPAGWEVRADAGAAERHEDAAVIHAVRDSLAYFNANRERLFTDPTDPAAD